MPLINAELLQTADGVLWWSAIVVDRQGMPGRGWVGMRWDPDGTEGPAVVASHPDQHVWAPSPAGPAAAAWVEGPATPRPPGCVLSGGRVVEVRTGAGPGELWLVDPDGAERQLTAHPAHDTAPVCDAERSRVWFLSDRRVGTRALRLWWVRIP